MPCVGHGGADPVACTAPYDGEIPQLSWLPRSDWINVQDRSWPNDVSLAQPRTPTNESARARGDGVADDTSAIQAALDRIGVHPGDTKVVYLPAGTYRITRTLALHARIGAMLVGDGARSRILWDGVDGGRMFWSDGVTYSAYIGLVWDGAHKAGVGIDHDSQTLYETRVRHEHMAFRGFRLAGIRVGHQQVQASAEMMFYNLRFNDNKNGVLLQSWNDYNNVFDGCEFANNGTGIRVEKGNVVVRNTRFAASADTDVFLSTHSHSLRRVVSSGSRQFIATVRGPAASGAITVEDCAVDGWKNPDGAVVSELRGPLTVFDCRFTHGPLASSPIRLAQPRYMSQQAMISNVRSDQPVAIVQGQIGGAAVEVPGGTRGVPLVGVGQHFLRAPWRESALRDVRNDCGARGDGVADDGAALQRCLQLAAARPGTAIYLPSGVYATSQTLRVRGHDVALRGTGFHSQIVWRGRAHGVVLDASEARGALLEQFAVGAADDSVRVQLSNHVRVRLNGVFGYSADEKELHGFAVQALAADAVVLADHIDGALNVSDIGAGTVLFGYALSQHLQLVAATRLGGTVGINTLVSCCTSVPLRIQGNQSLLLTDWYNEQSAGLLSVTGNASGLPARLALDLKQAETNETRLGSIDGWRGRVSISGGIFGRAEDPRSRELELRNSARMQLSIFGGVFRNALPVVHRTGGSLTVLQNNIDAANQPFAQVPNQITAAGATHVAQALDDFRDLGLMDLRRNYCLAIGEPTRPQQAVRVIGASAPVTAQGRAVR